ncbi:MAG TPA: hypothetical protein VK324_05605 [Tepidisphaeraceae bacterium]|nr:hypothetical protein [Tepidisphaeraceae bacterium]
MSDAVPQFNYVPVLADSEKVRLSVVTLAGVSTKHGSTDTDRGRLYGTAAAQPGGAVRLSLFAKVSKPADALVLKGEGAVGEYFDLVEQNGSGMEGQARIDAHAADDAGIVVVVTFASDRDVVLAAAEAAAMPGFDDAYGLAELHATAVQTIMTEALPAAVPHLFGGRGMSAFVPHAADAAFPDLRKLANADQLRVAQGNLVKALSFEQREHLEEFAAIAAAARVRFDEAMGRLQAGNKPADDAAATQLPTATAGVSFGSFTRG